ncbi:MAG: Ig-like domain-containing protein [Corynebacterium sp.]|uniref:L,D-transpeptidase n=1 Tax=Corynebacterium sp. TaxID=1720 RepID=UPI0026DC8A9D|nr:Ig-like domain-containing protein [Corynebacterium sp.]MDO5030717.1 Ig-like domain-containing protein [Corynebacterium sp.]
MRRTFKRLSMTIVAFATTATMVACSSGGAESEQAAAEPDAGLVASVKDDATDVSVIDPVTVQVEKGHRLDKVKLLNEEGKEVDGELDPSGTKWTTTEPLGYSKTYELNATSGKEKLASSFTTVTPNNQTYGYVSPAEGSTVGVGQTIAVRFDEPIADRKAAQDAIKVTTEPHVEGAFYWLTNSEVRWRPENYWEPGTKVSVKVDTYGKDLGDSLYGQEASETNFTIGDEVIATADDSTKTMTIEKNGEVINSMPISMGSNVHPTPNGQYILGDHNESMVMDSRTYGLSLEAGGYVTPVNYATQMSYSGIYVHGAPWSTWAQGSVNQSHGCINVTDANAKWFLENTKRGDIVIVKNTVGETLSGVDGLGDWNIPWETWKKGNADEGY